jgi:hypothetical protein
METSITSAMQYLQSKGLCLMPVALASAISTQKGVSAAAVPPERWDKDTLLPHEHEETAADDRTQTAEECSNAKPVEYSIGS